MINMKKGLKFSTVAILLVLFMVATGSVVLASSSLIPSQITDIFNLLGPQGICASDYITTRVRWAFFLVLGGLVLVSVVYSIIAAYKYITSQGETGKIEEANKSIKAIFMGIGAMAVGIIGIVIVYAVIGVNQTNPDLAQVCISAPTSAGCQACQDNVDSTLCVDCEALYKKACDDLGSNATSSEVLSKINDSDCKAK